MLVWNFYPRNAGSRIIRRELQRNVAYQLVLLLGRHLVVEVTPCVVRKLADDKEVGADTNGPDVDGRIVGAAAVVKVVGCELRRHVPAGTETCEAKSATSIASLHFASQITA